MHHCLDPGTIEPVIFAHQVAGQLMRGVASGVRGLVDARAVRPAAVLVPRVGGHHDHCPTAARMSSPATGRAESS